MTRDLTADMTRAEQSAGRRRPSSTWRTARAPATCRRRSGLVTSRPLCAPSRRTGLSICLGRAREGASRVALLSGRRVRPRGRGHGVTSILTQPGWPTRPGCVCSPRVTTA